MRNSIKLSKKKNKCSSKRLKKSKKTIGQVCFNVNFKNF